jgi:hypothetical protein
VNSSEFPPFSVHPPPLVHFHTFDTFQRFWLSGSLFLSQLACIWVRIDVGDESSVVWCSKGSFSWWRDLLGAPHRHLQSIDGSSGKRSQTNIQPSLQSLDSQDPSQNGRWKLLQVHVKANWSRQYLFLIIAFFPQLPYLGVEQSFPIHRHRLGK